MIRTMLQGKVHRARVTMANVEYEGSISVDANLLQAAGILPYELVHVLDVTNGARLQTYAIEAAAGSGEVCVNGAAAQLVHAGDTVIVLSYCQMEEAEAHRFQPNLVYVDAANRITRQVSRNRVAAMIA